MSATDTPVPGIDIGPVTAWLEANVAGARGPFEFEVIAGGHSNLTFKVTGADGTKTRILGNARGNNENPHTVSGAEGGPHVYFTDSLGERHDFKQTDGRLLSPVQASFVPRELIRGRAVLVVWPMVPSLDVYRFRWVR